MLEILIRLKILHIFNCQLISFVVVKCLLTLFLGLFKQLSVGGQL